MTLETTQLPPVTCPACSYELTACSGAGTPVAGDLSLCWGCGEVLTFDEQLHQVRLPRAGLEQLDAPTRAWVLQIQASIRLRRARGAAARA